VVSRPSPYQIALTPLERERPERRVRRQTATNAMSSEPGVVLFAPSGPRNDEIVLRLGTARETVSRWRKRYFEESDTGLTQRAGMSPDAREGVTSDLTPVEAQAADRRETQEQREANRSKKE